MFFTHLFIHFINMSGHFLCARERSYSDKQDTVPGSKDFRETGKKTGHYNSICQVVERREHRGCPGAHRRDMMADPASSHYLHFLPDCLGRLPRSRNDQCFPPIVQ